MGGGTTFILTTTCGKNSQSMSYRKGKSEPPLPFRGRGLHLTISLRKLFRGWGVCLKQHIKFPPLREFDIPFGKGSGREGFH